MACEGVIDFLVRETGRFDREIYSRMFPKSFWIGLTAKDTFPEGIGTTISNLTYERKVPSEATPTWETVTISDLAEGGACLPPTTTISVGSTTRSYSLQRKALQGPDICAEEIRFPFQAAAQLNEVLRIITEYATWEWTIRLQQDYLDQVKRRVVVGSSQLHETTNGAWQAACPGGQLTQGVLNRYKLKLLRDGAAGMGVENGAKILTGVFSPETSDNLIFQNADIRQDIRWGRPSELLSPYGVERSYRGFYHMVDLFPIRYSCTGGTFTKLAFFADEAATKGAKSEVASTYEGGVYETSFIFDPTVHTCRIPKPIASSGGNTRFNALNYSVGAGGSWSLKNIIDRVCNPDGTIVYHRGVIARGTEPVHPERGVAFAHLRCDPSLNMITSCT